MPVISLELSNYQLGFTAVVSVKDYNINVMLNTVNHIYATFTANDRLLFHYDSANTKQTFMNHNNKLAICMCCGNFRCSSCASVIHPYLNARTKLLIEIIYNRELLEFEIEKTCNHLVRLFEDEITPDLLNSVGVQTLTKRALS